MRAVIILITTAFLSGAGLFSAEPSAVPKTWDDREMETLELPLPQHVGPRKQVPADFYYRLPVRTIYKSYPIYAPGHEASGYMNWLQAQQPEIVWDEEGQRPELNTEADWIRAGALVFDAPAGYGLGNNLGFTVDDVRNPAWYAATGMPVAADGTMPFARYVIREKGKVEVGRLACAMCHTRLMQDGTLVKGAQGNFPFGSWVAANIRRRPQSPEKIHEDLVALAGAPYIEVDPLGPLANITAEQYASLFAALPPGVVARTGTSLLFPVQIPDLIGVKDRHYLDHTGLQQHRSIADLMRYAAINQGMDLFEGFGGFIPFGGPKHDRLPDAGSSQSQRRLERYSDAQLYALAQYVYSLQPPVNPNRLDAKAARGKRVFAREGCAQCHTPPLYTNNRLIPTTGFRIPEGHLKSYEILPVSVGTNSGLTMKTRRGTGYYKVPSLKGVWYRSMFEHSGAVATLEDWFDPRRLRADYAPTGFKGAGVTNRAVEGHPFGVNLPGDDRRALIAFLKTL